MKHRSTIATALVCTMLAWASPKSAHAEDPSDVAPSDVELALAAPTAPVASERPIWLAAAVTPIDLRPRLALVAPSLASLPSPFTKSPANIRLTRGQTTLIIVGAIILGALIIVGGVYFITKPGKHAPDPRP